MTSGNVMERLKQETAHYHRQIEQNEFAKAIMNAAITIEDYKRYLEKFYGFLKPLEEQANKLALWEGTGLEIEVRAKVPLLEQDLRHLGTSEEQLSKLPLCSELPDISTPARWLGYMYVIEGSTNGGQILTKKLSQCLPLDAGRGLKYFNAYGEDTRARWADFRELMLRNVSTPSEADEAVQAAAETFRLLDQWIMVAYIQ